MKANKMALLAGLAASLSGLSCIVDDVVSIQVKQTMAGAIDDACVVSKSDTQLASGSVDLAYTDSYLLALLVASHLSSEDTTSGGETVQYGSRNDFYVKKIEIRYSGEGVPDIDADERLRTATIPAGGELYMGLNVLSAEAAQKLAGRASAGRIEVIVSVVIHGEFAHGSEYVTAPFDFPLTVYSTTAPRCTADQKMVSRSGTNPPCMNFGQDGSTYYCEGTTPAQ